jgi:hypothetical protein
MHTFPNLLYAHMHGVIYRFDHLSVSKTQQTNKQTPWLLARKLSLPTERPPMVAEFQCQLLRIEGCRVVSAAVPHGR